MAKPTPSLTVLKYQLDAQRELARRVARLDAEVETGIGECESLLRSVGRSLPNGKQGSRAPSSRLELRPWKTILAEAQLHVQAVTFADLLTNEEIGERLAWLDDLREEFNAAHRLDATEVAIAGVAGTLAALVDTFLVVMPSAPAMLGRAARNGGALSNLFRQRLRTLFSPEQIAILERSFRVPYDATHSGDLRVPVPGLSSRTHRFHSLGHDPLLGFVFGVLDIMQGGMTTIDVRGRIRRQVTQPRRGIGIFEAIARQIGHLMSDIGTPAGLPAPLMPLLQLLGTGNVGDSRSIGDLPRLMYAQGYDFGHFLALSTPTVLVEVIVRAAYFLKRRAEGCSVTDALPIQQPGGPRPPKLNTMLATAHLIAAGVNGTRAAITQNPLALNYVEWMAFARAATDQLCWLSTGRRAARNKHVQARLEARWDELRVALSTW